MMNIKRDLSLINKEKNLGTRVLYHTVIIYFYLYNVDISLYIYFFIFSSCLDIPPSLINLRHNAVEICKHSKKSKRKACDNRVAIAWVSLILEVKTHKSKKNGLINFSW